MLNDSSRLNFTPQLNSNKVGHGSGQSSQRASMYHKPVFELKGQNHRQASNLSQSLESFVKQTTGEAVQQIQGLNVSSLDHSSMSDKIQRQHMKPPAGPKPQQHFETFNQQSPSAATASPAGDELSQTQQQHPISQLEYKLITLVEELQIKKKTILSMQSELDRLKADNDLKEHELWEQIRALDDKLVDMQAEKDSLMNVYKQENAMRQELEEQLDQIKTSHNEATDKIQILEREGQSLMARLEQEQIDKQKTEQSQAYWQNSFKQMEQHHHDEKQKTEAEVARLTEQLHQYSLRHQENQDELDILFNEKENLLTFKNKVVKARVEAADVECQTEETMEWVQSCVMANKQLSMENGQVQRDIQVLLDSYDNYKQESQYLQDDLRRQIEELKLKLEESEQDRTQIVDHLNAELQEEIAAKLDKDDQLQKAAKKISGMAFELEQKTTQLGQAEEKAAALEEEVQELGAENERLVGLKDQLQQQLAQFQQMGLMSHQSLNLNNFITSDRSSALVKSHQSIGQFAAQMQHFNGVMKVGQPNQAFTPDGDQQSHFTLFNGKLNQHVQPELTRLQ